MTGTAGSVSLPPVWLQTDASTDWNHVLDGPDRTYEHVQEVSDIVITAPGVYEVDYTARGVISVPANVAGSAVIVAGVALNGALINGSESMPINFGPSTGVPQLWVSQSQSGNPFVQRFAAGDVIQLWAYRIGQPHNCSIVSNVDGRTRIQLNRIAQ